MDVARTAYWVAIPPHLTFADLALDRDPNGRLTYATATLEAIALANDLTVDQLAEEGAFRQLLTAWYRYHRNIGGACHAVMEALIAGSDAHRAHVAPTVLQ